MNWGTTAPLTSSTRQDRIGVSSDSWQVWANIAIVTTFAVIPITYVSLFDLFGGSLGGLSWVLVGALAVWALAQIPGLRVGPTRGRLLFAFVALGAITVALTGASVSGLHTLGQFTSFAAIFLVAATVAPTDRQVQIINRLAWSWLYLGSAIGIAASVSPAVLERISPRALTMTLSILFVLVTTFQKRPALVAIAGGLALVPAVLTTSRTATIVTLCLIFYRLSRSASLRLKVAAGLLGLASLFVVFNTPEFQQRMFFGGSGTIADLAGGGVNTMGRAEIWPVVFSRCLETPWFGSGMGSVGETMADLAQPGFAHPHNDYLRLFCDVGLVGLVSFWGFLIGLLMFGRPRGSRKGDERTALYHASAMVVACIALFSFTDNIIIYMPHFMLPAAVVLGWLSLATRSTSLHDASDSGFGLSH